MLLSLFTQRVILTCFWIRSAKTGETFPEAFEILIALLVSAHSADFCVEKCPNWNLLG